jgi:hypothetical protein
MIQYLHSNSNIIARSMFDMLQVSSRCQLWPVVFASLHRPRTEPNCPIARGRLCGESSGTSEDVGVSVADEGGYVLFLDGESPRVSIFTTPLAPLIADHERTGCRVAAVEGGFGVEALCHHVRR